MDHCPPLDKFAPASAHRARLRRIVRAARFPLRPLVAAVACAFLAPAHAQLPASATVIHGSATIAANGARMTVTNSPNSILNWQSFSIGAQNGVHFQQQSATSQVLNRVTGADPSQILGSLSSNGRVWLINPRGIVFGQNARIDVAGLVASTLDIANADFLASRFQFAHTGAPPAEVLNQGQIRTTFGGRVWLLGDKVRNEGLVSSPGGQLVLAAGRSIELVDSGLPNVVVRVSAPENEVVNLGSLIADSGRVDLHGSIVNQRGLIRADQVGTDAAGQLVLHARDSVLLSDNSETSARGGEVEVAAPDVSNRGRIDGLDIRINAENILQQGEISAPAGRIILAAGSTATPEDLTAKTAIATVAPPRFGRVLFSRTASPPGIVRNEGTIATSRGGSVSLLGTQVINTGLISTIGGTTALIAGDRVELAFAGDGAVRYQVEAAAANALVQQSGRVEADGGRILMKASPKGSPLNISLNVEGSVRARGNHLRSGEINLDGGSGVVSVTGHLDASSLDATRSGGEIRILGERVGLFEQARIDASGSAGGGTILIGGNYQGKGSERNARQTHVGANVVMSADAGSTGDGGKVIVWADDWTRYHGTISAKGGERGGDGGFVEVSGKQNLTFDGDVVTSAAKGKAGMLLLDPGDLYFSATAVGGATELTGPSVFQTANATDDFYVLSSRFGSASSSYALQAHNDVILNTNASFASTAGRTVSITAGNSIRSNNFSISTAGADLNLTAQSMTLGAVSTGVGALTVDVTGVGQSATQSGVFSGGLLTKLGVGTLELSQANTYTGGTVIQAGTLSARHAQALNQGKVTVQSGGTLSIDGVNLSLANGLDLSGTGVGGAGALTGTGTAAYTGDVTLLTDSHVGTATVSDQLTLTGAITGPHALYKVGAGTVVLSSANTYTGGTLVQQGTLSARHAQALNQGRVVVASGGTLNIDNVALSLANGLDLSGTGAGGVGALTGTGTAAYTGDVTLIADSRVGTATGRDQLTLSGAITGANRQLEKVGAGTVILGNASNTYSGGTTISAGTLRTSVASALPDDQAVGVGTGGTLDVNDQSIGTLTGDGTVTLGAGTLTVGDGDFGGHIGGTGGLNKTSIGTLTLSNSNTYTGGTTIQQGTLSARHAQALNQGKVTVADGATLNIDGVTLSLANGLDLSGTGAGGVGALTGAGTAAYTGGVTLIADSRVGAATTSDQLTLSGIIAGATSKLEKTGVGKVTLTAANTYGGGTTIQQGTLSAKHAQALNQGQVTVADGATLNIDGVTLALTNGLDLSGTGVGGAGALTGTGTAAYSGGITLVTNSRIGAAIASDQLTLSGIIAGATSKLEKTGDGTVTLAAANTYTGGTTIQAGTLSARHAQALNQGQATVADGATLHIDNVTLSLANGLDLSGAGAGGAGALTGTGTAAYTGGVTLIADSRVGAATTSDQLTLSGIIAGATRKLEKTGAGKVTLSAANTYTGGTTIQEGTLSTQHAQALNTGKVEVANGATLNIDGVTLALSNGLDLSGDGVGGVGALTGTGTAAYTGGVTLVADSRVGAATTSDQLTLSGAITGANRLEKSGAGTVILDNANNDYSGGTTISAGTLRTNVASALPDDRAVSVGTSGTLDLLSHDQSIGTLTGDGSVTLGNATLTVRDGDFTGQIGGGTGRLSKTSGGTLILSNANTYTGGTTIQQGTLSAQHAQALNQGKVTVANGATLNIDGVTLALSNGLDLSGDGVGGVGALTGTGTAAYTGGVTLVADSRVGAATTSDQLTLSGAITGANRLEKSGAGTVLLDNANNDYSGGTTISAGTLRTNVASALPDDRAVSVGTGGTLDIDGHDQLIGTLTGGGSVPLGNATLTVRDGDFAGDIAGTGRLSKTSSGTLILSSANTYTGGTTIQQGTLSAQHAQALNQGQVTVADGATLHIDNVTLSLANGLDLSGTGAGGAGALTGTGTATYTGGVTLIADSRVGVATASDQLTLSGAITGANRLEKSGAGTVILDNANNDYSGGTTISAGTLRTNVASALPDDRAVSVATGGTLDIDGHDQSIGSLTGDGSVTLGNATLTVRDGDFAGQIGGSTGRLSKTSSGTLILSNANTYTGGTTIQQGTLTARHAQALNQGQVTVLSGATLHIDNVTLSLANGLDLSGTGAIGAGALTGTGTAAYAGGVTLIADSRIGAATTSDQLTLIGAVTGAGRTLEKAGDGTVVLANSGNDYSGGTTISAGTLATSVASALPDNRAVSVSTGGSLDLRDNDQSIGTLAGDGSVTLGSATLTVRDGNFAGHIGGNAGRLSKTSTGTLVLSNSNTLGETTVQQGTLIARHAQALSQGKVSVANGGTLDIDNVDLSLANGLDISGDGAGGVGALTGTGTAGYTGRISLLADAQVTASTFNDRLTLNGPINGGGNAFTIAGSGTVVLMGTVSDAGRIEQPATSRIDLGSGQTVETRFGQVYRGVVTGTDVRLTSTQGGAIEADTVGNDFSGRLTVSAQNVTLRDANALALDGQVSGNLITTSQALLLGATTVGGTAVLNTGGSVTQDGDARVTGTTAINAAGQSVFLDRLGNDFGGRVTIAAGDVILRDANALDLAGTVSGNLVATSQALQLGSTTVAGRATIDASGPVTQTGVLRAGAAVQITADTLTIDPASGIISAAPGDAITVVAARFDNQAGASAFSTPNGRWLAYVADPATSVEGFAGYSKHYDQPYTGTTPAYAAAGDWFFYNTAPTLALRPGAQTVTYGEATPSVFTPGFSGFIDGDTPATAGISGAAIWTVAGQTSSSGHLIAGGHEVALAGGLASSLGYRIADDTTSTAELTIAAKSLVGTFTGSNKVYDGTTAATVSASSPDLIPGDVVRFGQVAAFRDTSIGLAKPIDVTAITLDGPDASNYALTSTTALTVADILPPAGASPSAYGIPGQEAVQTSVEVVNTAIALALPVVAPQISRVTDLSTAVSSFASVNLADMSREQMQHVLALRQEFKSKLFADTIYELELDPSLAEVRPCASLAEASSGLCRMTDAQRGEFAAQAPTTETLRPRRRVRLVKLPQIERKVAVLFGINDYADRKIPQLTNAVPDAEMVGALMADRLGYEVRVVKNPSKADIVRTLNELSLEVSRNDSVIIYYAGHGYLIDKTGVGYWLPGDASSRSPKQWLSNTDVSRMLAAIGAKQVAMISDSCYSGAFTKEREVGLSGEEVRPEEILARRSVVVMSSGGDEPVPDGGKDGHSIFAWQLAKALGQVETWQPGTKVFERVRRDVHEMFPQTPQYGASVLAGHQAGGDYLFESRQLEELR